MADEDPLGLDPFSPLPRVNALAARTLTIEAVKLDDMPVVYEYGEFPATLRFRTEMGMLVAIKMTLDDFEALLARQNEVVPIMREDALK